MMASRLAIQPSSLNGLKRTTIVAFGQTAATTSISSITSPIASGSSWSAGDRLDVPDHHIGSCRRQPH